MTRTLGEWLKAFEAASGHLGGIPPGRLIGAANKDGMLSGWEVEDPLGVADFMEALAVLERLARHGDPWWQRFGRLLIHCIWLDDGADESIAELARFAGLDKAPEPPRNLTPYPPFDGLLALCNSAMSAKGIAERLYPVEGVDGYLVIRLLPEAFERLRAEGLLKSHAPAPWAPVPKEAKPRAPLPMKWLHPALVVVGVGVTAVIARFNVSVAEIAGVITGVVALDWAKRSIRGLISRKTSF